MEWTCIRRYASDHNCDVKCDSEASESDEGECDRVNGPHVSAETAGEKGEGNLEHHRGTRRRNVMTISRIHRSYVATSASLDRRPIQIAQVSVQPLLAQHRDGCGEHGDCETRAHETGDGGDLARQAFPNRWNDGGFTGDGGLIESEEDSSEEGRRLFVGSGWRFEWTSMTKAELTAGNRPAYRNR